MPIGTICIIVCAGVDVLGLPHCLTITSPIFASICGNIFHVDIIEDHTFAQYNIDCKFIQVIFKSLCI